MIQTELYRNLKLVEAMRASLREFSMRLYEKDDTREAEIRLRVDEGFEATTKLRDYLEAKQTKYLAHAIDTGVSTEDAERPLPGAPRH